MYDIINVPNILGGLSHWIQKAVHSHPDTQFVLIDKGCVRYKVKPSPLSPYSLGSMLLALIETLLFKSVTFDLTPCLYYASNNAKGKSLEHIVALGFSMDLIKQNQFFHAPRKLL